MTGGQTNEAAGAAGDPRIAATPRRGCSSHGVRFQPSLGGTLHLGRTNAFFLGGGKALMNAYYAAAQKRGVRVLYNAEVIGL